MHRIWLRILIALLCAALLGNGVLAADCATLVIDAGHGGEDGGALTAEGVPESGINLSIALKLRALAGLFGVQTVMTRESEQLDYPDEADSISKKKVYDQHSRVALINSVENAMLFSIHQNRYPDSRPSGAQVFYGRAEGSQTLAELCQKNLTQQLCPENRRLAAPISEDIYLMKNIDCTAILIECGFLSNPSEAALLQTGDYQKKLAVVMLACFLQYTEERGGSDASSNGGDL